jgi:hypothetical protein
VTAADIVLMELSPLQCISIYGHSHILSYFLNFPNSFDPNAINSFYGFSALHFAVIYNQLAIVEELCYHHSIRLYDRTTYNGKNILQLAIEKGNVEILRFLLNHFRKLVEQESKLLSASTKLTSSTGSQHNEQLQEHVLYHSSAKLQHQERSLAINCHYNQIFNLFKDQDYDGNSLFHTMAYYPSITVFKLVTEMLDDLYFFNPCADSIKILGKVIFVPQTACHGGVNLINDFDPVPDSDQIGCDRPLTADNSYYQLVKRKRQILQVSAMSQ